MGRKLDYHYTQILIAAFVTQLRRRERRGDRERIETTLTNTNPSTLLMLSFSLYFIVTTAAAIIIASGLNYSIGLFPIYILTLVC